MSEQINPAAPSDAGASNEPERSPPSVSAASEPANDSGAPLHSEPERSEADRRENAIPHYRVKEMVSRAEERVRQEYAQRIADFERRIAEYEGKAPEPKPETPEPSATPEPSQPREGINWRALMREGERSRERESAMRERYAREASIRVQAERFQIAWDSIQREHSAVLDMPGAPAALKEAALEAWRTGGDPLAAARSVGRAFAFQAAQLERARDEQRAALRASAPKVGRSGQGAGAPATKSTGSIANRISDGLAARSGNGY